MVTLDSFGNNLENAWNIEVIIGIESSKLKHSIDKKQKLKENETYDSF